MRPQSDTQCHAQHGSVIIAAMVFLVVVAAAAAGISHLTFSSAMVSTERVDSERAFYAAESARLMGWSRTESINFGNNTDDLGANYDGGEYRGWVGDSWNDARARHAIETGGGPWKDPNDPHWDEPDNAYNPDDIKDTTFNDLAITKKISGGPHVTITGGLYINAKVAGSSQWEVQGDACIGNDAELKGWPGQSAFEGNVFFENEEAIDAVEVGGGGPPGGGGGPPGGGGGPPGGGGGPPGGNYDGCVYVNGELDEERSGASGCDEDKSIWCGIGGFDGGGGGGSWGYASSD
ncbi:hypothetical protein Dret_1998 [Desulfohalobium retbaense DSM 5692]|uniref:Type 4 fimbrial biogenesis protein PilX N-terminal domain-containing protein n=2 Tax=Desulfohalobium TaxID=45662 RepID=C8X4Q9_DESRD|nr:hypothetical protein Dret_1998 [Desulfohalobium retbaense DSM 5692]